MKLILAPSMGKRPLWPTRITIFIMGLIGLIIGVNLSIAGSQMGWVVILLARLGLRFIPPALWIGSVLIVAFWLAVLYHAWRK